jgi:TolB-like protein
MKTISFFLTIIFCLMLTVSINPQQQAKKITLAVLYFDNNSIADKEKMEPLGKGMASMLITELTKVKAFRVVERERLNDVLAELKLSQTGVIEQSTAQKIGKLLGAQTLLLGSFMNSFGAKIRVDLRIVETETGLTLKAEEVTGDLDDLFDIVRDLAVKVTDKFEVKLSSDEKNELEQNKKGVNVESSLLYSQAVNLEDAARENYKTGDKNKAIDTYKSAIELYNKALKINPNLTDAKIKGDNLSGLISEINMPDVKIEKIQSPAITIIEPAGYEKGSIVHRESVIAVRFKVEDPNGVSQVEVNNTKAEKLSNGEYICNVPIVQGINDLTVRAINGKDYQTSKFIRVVMPSPNSGTVISITEPAVTRGIKIVSKKDLITVKGTAVDVSGIIEVTVNNRQAALNPNGEFSIQMNLELGENKLIVKAINTGKAVKTDTFTVVRNAEEIIAGGRYIAFVIGINSYSGYWRPLNNALNDAKGMADILKNEYKFDEVITLYDKDATRKNIIQKFEWLANNLSKEDNLLIFYSGHGQLNKVLNKGYWVPVDAASNSVADYISNSDIKTFLGGIPSKHTFLVTDACFAGDIFRGSSQTEQVQFDPNNMDKYYKEVYRKQSRLALTSGGLEEVMDAGKEGHSIFTYYLLKALKENNKKYIDASQLFNEFRVAVSNNSEQTPQLQSVKDTNDEGGQFVFIKR